MECSQDEKVLLDTKIVATPIADKEVVITTSISAQIHVILKIKPKIYLLG